MANERIIGPSPDEIRELNKLFGPIKKSRWIGAAGAVLGLSSATTLAACAPPKPAVISEIKTPDYGLKTTPTAEDILNQPAQERIIPVEAFDPDNRNKRVKFQFIETNDKGIKSRQVVFADGIRRNYTVVLTQSKDQKLHIEYVTLKTPGLKSLSFFDFQLRLSPAEGGEAEKLYIQRAVNAWEKGEVERATIRDLDNSITADIRKNPNNQNIIQQVLGILGPRTVSAAEIEPSDSESLPSEVTPTPTAEAKAEELPWKEALNLTPNGPLTVDSTGNKSQVLAEGIRINGAFRLKVDAKTEGEKSAMYLAGENKQQITILWEKGQRRVNIMDITPAGVLDLSGLTEPFSLKIEGDKVTAEDEEGHTKNFKTRKELNLDRATISATALNGTMALEASLLAQSDEVVIAPPAPPTPTATNTRVPAPATSTPDVKPTTAPPPPATPTFVPTPRPENTPTPSAAVEREVNLGIPGLRIYNIGTRYGIDVWEIGWGTRNENIAKLSGLFSQYANGKQLEIRFYDNVSNDPFKDQSKRGDFYTYFAKQENGVMKVYIAVSEGQNIGDLFNKGSLLSQQMSNVVDRVVLENWIANDEARILNLQASANTRPANLTNPALMGPIPISKIAY